MHGAAHTANAPPSRKPEPLPPRSLDEPGADEPLRPGEQAHEDEAEDDQDEARDLLEQELIAREREPDGGRARAEEHEHGDEPGDEREAGDDDAAGGSRLAQPLRLDRGHGRQVAGDERQHARREERDEAGAERDGDRGAAHSKRSSASSRRCSSTGSSGSPSSPSGGAPPRTRLQRQASAPTATMPDCEPGERQQPGDEVESLARRHGEDGGPELVDELRLDLALRVAGRDPGADVRLHPQRDRRVGGVERRLADRADELGLELGGCRLQLARRLPAAARAAQRPAASASLIRPALARARCLRRARKPPRSHRRSASGPCPSRRRSTSPDSA